MSGKKNPVSSLPFSNRAGEPPINNIKTAWSSGVVLHKLLASLSGEKVGPLNAKPTMKVQKIENLSFCLNFMKSQGIHFENMGPLGTYFFLCPFPLPALPFRFPSPPHPPFPSPSPRSDIYEENYTLIMGMLWKIISHYQVAGQIQQFDKSHQGFNILFCAFLSSINSLVQNKQKRRQRKKIIELSWNRRKRTSWSGAKLGVRPMALR